MSDESKEKDDGLGCILMIIVMLFMMHCCTSLSNLESDMQVIKANPTEILNRGK